MLLDRNDCLLLIIDWQSGLTAALPDAASARQAIMALVEAAHRFSVPVLASEHCAGKIGYTEPALRDRIDEAHILGKTRFSLPREPGALERLRSHGRRRVLVCGAEAHICVLQSALELSGAGFTVHPVRDAMATRRAQDHDAALDRFRHHGLETVTTDMVMFEWIGDAGSDDFRALLPAVKARVA